MTTTTVRDLLHVEQLAKAVTPDIGDIRAMPFTPSEKAPGNTGHPVSRGPQTLKGPQVPGTPKIARPLFAPDPHAEIVRVEHIGRPGEERWTLMDHWFASPTLIWRERMPAWQLPGMALASLEDLHAWAAEPSFFNEEAHHATR